MVEEATFPVKIKLTGEQDKQNKRTSRSAAKGGFIGSILGQLLGSVKQLFDPLKAMSTLLVAALFPLLKPFLILFIKVGVMLFKFLQGLLGGERGPTSSLSGNAGLSEEDIAKIKKTGELQNLSQQQIQDNINKANELEKKKNQVLAYTGLILGGIIGVIAALLAGFVSIPSLIIAAIIGGILGLVTIIFGRDVADNLINIVTESLKYLYESLLNFPRNISAAFDVFVGWLSNGLSNIWESIKTTIKDSFNGLLDIGKSFVNAIISGLNTIIDALNSIDVFGWNANISNIKSVEDAIITPKGDLIRTNPNDYLIATKNPGSFGGGSSNVNVTINGGLITQEVASQIGRLIQRELNTGGRY